MPDPLGFDDTTPRFGLPFMFAAQAQKESFVNEIAARCDILLHCAIEAATNLPPTAPADGQCWLVTSGAAGAWAGKSDMIAAWVGGGWIFLPARPGMRVYDRAARQDRFFSDTWQVAGQPAGPTGGAVIDSQARAAIAQIYGILATVGIIPS